MGDAGDEKIGWFGAKRHAEQLRDEVADLRAALSSCGEANQQLRMQLERVGAQDPTEIAGEATAARVQIDQIRRGLADARADADREIREVQIAIAAERARLDGLRQDVVQTAEEKVLQEAGVYEYSHPVENSVQFKDELDQIKSQIKASVKADGGAVTSATEWTVNGSAAQGRKMLAETSKLMLRAYNAEADVLVRGMKPYKVKSAIERLEKTSRVIQRLGSSMNIRITPAYHRLRVRELQLTADYIDKLAAEKEAEREERARLAEERKAQQELERERKRLEKERAHVQNAMAALQAKGDVEAVARLEAQLADVDRAIHDVDYRAANVRAGYVYVISNVGAFGPRMVKIGMTRRLEPLDRVNELGDASVPFRFDVHALFFSNDAVGIETSLHRHFSAQRVNLVNNRREFFYASPAEVHEVLAGLTGEVLEYHDTPSAVEFRASEVERRALSGDSPPTAPAPMTGPAMEARI